MPGMWNTTTMMRSNRLYSSVVRVIVCIVNGFYLSLSGSIIRG